MNRVISYKYPDTLSTLYKKDYRSNKPFLETCPHGKKLQFILEKEKRNVKIDSHPKMYLQTIKQQDYQPFLIKYSC